MLSSSCLQRPIQVVIFFSVFMKEKKTKVASNEVQQTVLHKSCSHFIPTCEGSVQVEKRVWSFSRCVRFGVLSQKQTTTLALGLFSRRTSQIERLFDCFWTCVMKMPPFLLNQTVLHLMVVKSNLKITIL